MSTYMLGLRSAGVWSVDSDTILIRSTRFGDADLNGFVNLDDFNRLAANFGIGDVWTEGDFNYDGITNLSDFNLLAGNFGLSAGPEGPTPEDWAELETPVPEPSSLIVASASFFLTLRRWNRAMARSV